MEPVVETEVIPEDYCFCWQMDFRWEGFEAGSAGGSGSATKVVDPYSYPVMTYITWHNEVVERLIGIR